MQSRVEGAGVVQFQVRKDHPLLMHVGRIRAPAAGRLAADVVVQNVDAAEFRDDTLDHARAAVERLSTCVAALDGYSESRADDPTLEAALTGARDAFRAAMDDDLNVSGALGAVFELVRDVNRRVDARSISSTDARRAAAALRDFDTVLGVIELPEALPEGAAALLEQRAAARAAREWAASDQLRDQLAALGVTVEDTRDGQRWRVSVRAADG